MVYLFSDRDKLREILKDKFIYLFLDYDGTLTPISSSPDKAPISNRARGLLSRLLKSPRCKLAIVSGRALKDIKNIVGEEGIVYVGNHGLEIEGPKLKFKSIVPSGFKELLQKIKYDLNKRLISIKGIFLEDKGYTLSLHYRLVPKERIPLVKAVFHETIIIHLVKNKIKINSGKKILEIRPPIQWDKGKSVLWLLARQEFASKDNAVFPVYIGDDITDEDAFAALRDKGLTIFVGKPKKTRARYYLKSTREVMELLARILELQKA
ncbi:MAG: trehalose-phosphatase [Candidatus Omnitrophota bacterium]